MIADGVHHHQRHGLFFFFFFNKVRLANTEEYAALVCQEHRRKRTSATEPCDVKAALMVVNRKGERVAINDSFFLRFIGKKMKAITSRNKIDNNG